MCKRFENLLAFHCSPALFGIKPSNLINVSIKDFPNIVDIVDELNHTFCNKICFEILRLTNSSALILVYQANKLQRALFKESNYNYLLKYNYPKNKSVREYIDLLKARLELTEFPHEIGVFLGYDLNDIVDFEKGDKKCIFIGCWKVFSNPDEKIKIFNQYTKCKNIVFSLLRKGYSLEGII